MILENFHDELIRYFSERVNLNEYQIASYLGILPESLSRMKKQLYV
ncbi:MAG: hypothetical protein ACKO7D_00415 [Bacteroidota bacterium]